MGLETKTYHIRRSKVVQQRRHLSLTTSSNRDIQHPLAPIIRLLKRHLTHIGLDAILQHLYIKEVPIPPEPGHPPPQRPQPRAKRLTGRLASDFPCKGTQIDPIPPQHPGQLLLVVYRHQGSHQRPGSRTCYDPRQQAPQEERLHDAQVAQPEDGASLQDEGAPPEGLAGIVDEIQLHLRRHAGPAVPPVAEDAIAAGARRQRPDVLYRLGHSGDVLLDQELGAGEGPVVEPRGGDVAQVPDQAGPQEVDQGVDVAGLARAVELQEALVDEPVVVVPRGRVVAPQVEAEEVVEVQGGLLPVLVGGGCAQDGEPEGGRGAGGEPGQEFLDEESSNPSAYFSWIGEGSAVTHLGTHPVPEEENINDHPPDGGYHRPGHSGVDD